MKLDLKELINKLVSYMPSYSQLTTGVTLYRIGKLRFLTLTNFQYGVYSFSIATGDRPSEKAVGIGTRDNSSAYITFVRIEVNTNGSIGYYLAGAYNTPTGYSLPVSGDIYSANVMWHI